MKELCQPRRSKRVSPKAKPEGVTKNKKRVQHRMLNMKTMKELGDGGYGFVFGGVLDDMDVVLKIAKNEHDESVKNEMKIYDILGSNFTVTPLIGWVPVKYSGVDAREFKKLNVDEIEVVEIDKSKIPRDYTVCTSTMGIVLERKVCSLDDYTFKNRRSIDTKWYKRNVKIFLWDIVSGVDYLEKCGVIHGDLKCGNVLIGKNTRASLCDFGVSVISRDGGDLQQKSRKCNYDSCTVYYKPPETILGMRHDSTIGDMWSVGCIFFNMLLGRHFIDRSVKNESFNALAMIYNWFDLPTPEKYPNFHQMFRANSFLDRYSDGEFDEFVTKKRQCLPEGLFENGLIEESARDLLFRLLDPNPSTRINSTDALKHKYFNQ
jgi:serine/threonine protein kinase